MSIKVLYQASTDNLFIRLKFYLRIFLFTEMQSYFSNGHIVVSFIESYERTLNLGCIKRKNGLTSLYHISTLTVDFCELTYMLIRSLTLLGNGGYKVLVSNIVYCA